MSLKQHSIDQGYKARLADLEVTPPAHAWAAIAAQLPNEKSDEKGAWWIGAGAAFAKTPGEKSKRERVLFWWWTGALLALAIISIFAYYGLNTPSTSNNPTLSPKSTTALLLPVATTETNNTNHELSTTLSETEEECPEVVSSNTSRSASTTAVAIATTPKAAMLARTRTARSSHIQSAKTQVRSVARILKTNSNQEETSSSAIATTTAANLISQLQEGSSLQTEPKTTTPPSSPHATGLSLASTSMSTLPFSSISLLETETIELPFGPGIGCEDFKNSASWSFAVRAFAGPGVLFQTFNSTDQTMAYETLRDSIETRQLSVHGGLRFEAVNDRGLFLRAGADYMMYRTNIVDAGAPRTRTIIDSVFMEDTQTWRVETRNEVFQRQRNVYNRQHAVVLTAGVGFRKTFGNVSPYLMAEAGYELLFKRKGDFVLPDGNFVDLAEDDQGLYINDQPGFQFGGVLGVDFALTDRIEAGISGHYKQLGGLRGSADLLDYSQSTAFGALNLRYTIR